MRYNNIVKYPSQQWPIFLINHAAMHLLKSQSFTAKPQLQAWLAIVSMPTIRDGRCSRTHDGFELVPFNQQRYSGMDLLSFGPTKQVVMYPPINKPQLLTSPSVL